MHENFAETAFGGLAPAGMIYIGIYVGVETIFVGSLTVPTRRRFGRLQADFYNGFDALVAVLPGNHHAYRSAVLVGKRFSVHAHTQKREWMHGFINSKPLHVRIVETGVFGLGHLLRIVKALESHIFCFRTRLN